MQIQPSIAISTAGATQNVANAGDSGGTSAGAGEGLRADWNIRMNVSHEQGFVGGAGRLLVHNQTAEDCTELVLFMPAAQPHKTGTLQLELAVVCSAKPGMPVAQGQQLVVTTRGHLAMVTVPLLKMSDWIYIDLTWRGSFQPEGMVFPGGLVPLGDFHPQVTIEAETPDGRKGRKAVLARYDVTLGSDLGATVRMDSEEFGKVVSRTSENGRMSEHEFKSFGAASILAKLAPPGAPSL